MFRSVLKAIRNYPITAGCVVLCILLHLTVVAFQGLFPERAQDAYWNLGHIEQLAIVGEPNLTGPLDLWGGEVWRIPISTLHHAGLIHLAFNVLWAAYAGRVLEPKMGSLRYLVFILSASIVASIPELAIGAYAIGFSGVGFAMFGILYVMRRHDTTVAASISDGLVRMFFACLFLCVLLTYLEIYRVANLAHFSGFIYGWGIGKIHYDLTPARRSLRTGFYVFHFLLIPAIVCVTKPVWNGRYHWYRATQGPDLDEKVAHWQKAVAWNPGLPEPWRNLSVVYYSRGQRLRAWRTILEALAYNRSYQEGIALCRAIWETLLPGDERQQATLTLQEVFPEELEAWKKRLGMQLSRVETAVQPAATLRDQQAPEVDPHAWYSALEGELL